jgi:hypothetical protein
MGNTFYLAVILPDGWVYFLWLLLVIGLSGILYFLYLQFFVPYLELKAKAVIPPPEEGTEFEIVVSELERNAVFTIGRIGGNMATKCSSISENHLIFQFKRLRESEEYDITVKKGGPTLVKPPKMNIYSNMDNILKLESHELISSSADFRLSDSIIKERMSSYLEIHLGSKFFINAKGAERMKFIFKLVKIHPGMHFKKSGTIYTLSRSSFREGEQETETE